MIYSPGSWSRRSIIAALSGAIARPAWATATRYRPIPKPDPRLWHIETAPAGEGDAPGPNGSVHYRSYGESGRTPVIVLHGGPAAGEAYMRPYVALSRDRQVVLYDQSGCGRSARPADLSLYTLDRYVDELEALRRHLRLLKIALVGHSWGGFLATAYTARHPQRVTALVLAGSAAAAADYSRAAHHWLSEFGPSALATVASVEAGGSSNAPAYAKLVDAYYRRHLCRLDPWPEFLQRTGEEIGSNPVYNRINGPSEFRFTGTMASFDFSAQLRSITAPALVTYGEYDEAPEWVAAKLSALLPNATRQAFHGLSHMAHIESPNVVIGATSAFLARVG